MEVKRHRLFRWPWVIPLLAILLLGSGLYLRTQYVVPVLMYHAVEGRNEDTEWTERWSISPESFERQVEFLVRRNYHVVSLDTLADLLEAGKPIPSKTVALTFDDGLASVYHNAFPVLKRLRLPATFFFATSLVGTPGYVTWEQVREMHAAGMTIGSHSATHRKLPGIDEATLHHEIFGSKQELERRLGVPVRHFSYPFGAHDARIRELVREAGYRTASATAPYRHTPPDDPYAIKRVNISRKSRSTNLLVFWTNCSGYYTWLKEQIDLFLKW